MSDLLDLVKNVSLDKDLKVVVKADELVSQRDWSLIFFEPEVGNQYTIKFLPNLDDRVGGDIIHRSYYKDLPDPNKKGNSFRYIPKTHDDPVLELFFELNDLKKSGDQVAEAKIKKYLQRKQQACCKIQILSSPKKEDIGKIKLFRFQSWGDNATIANLILQKERPSQAQIEDGDEKENIFNIFGSSVLNIVCEEANFAGEKGRSFTKSTWLRKNRGAFISLPSGDSHEFSENDLDENKNYKKEVIPYVEEFIKQLTDPSIAIGRWFSYCDETYPGLTEDEKQYFINNKKKVLEIVDVIRDRSLRDIANYGKADNSVKEGTAKNILQESIPDELADIVDKNDKPTVSTTNQSKQNVDDEIENLLK
jgi:hypothetical protein